VRFNLRDLQRVSGLSHRGLHKAFVKHLGCSPGVFLRMVRLERACDLLADSNLSVGEVARRCGYRSANSLWVVFARDLGVSPIRYRSQRQPKAVRGSKPSKTTRRRAIPATPLRNGLLAGSLASSWIQRGNRRNTTARLDVMLVKS
jgi:AraC-like DNA-binding protein